MFDADANAVVLDNIFGSVQVRLCNSPSVDKLLDGCDLESVGDGLRRGALVANLFMVCVCCVVYPLRFVDASTKNID